MKFIFYLFAISFCLYSCSNNENNNQRKSTNIRLDRHIDSVSYAIGLDLATRLKQEFKDVDLEMLTNGINDYFEGKDLTKLREKEKQKLKDRLLPDYWEEIKAKQNKYNPSFGKLMDIYAKKVEEWDRAGRSQYKDPFDN